MQFPELVDYITDLESEFTINDKQFIGEEELPCPKCVVDKLLEGKRTRVLKDLYDGAKDDPARLLMYLKAKHIMNTYAAQLYAELFVECMEMFDDGTE